MAGLLSSQDLSGLSSLWRGDSHPSSWLSPLAEKDWTDEDRAREKVLMQELMTLIEQRDAIVNCLDEDRQRCYA